MLKWGEGSLELPYHPFDVCATVKWNKGKGKMRTMIPFRYYQSAARAFREMKLAWDRVEVLLSHPLITLQIDEDRNIPIEGQKWVLIAIVSDVILETDTHLKC